jgi:hypothetical protein
MFSKQGQECNVHGFKKLKDIFYPGLEFKVKKQTFANVRRSKVDFFQQGILRSPPWAWRFFSHVSVGSSGIILMVSG